MGLYLLWLEKEQVSSTTKNLKNQFLNFKDSTKSQLDELNNELELLQDENQLLKKQIENYEIKIQNDKKAQELKVIIPNSQPDLSKIIRQDNNIIRYDSNLSLEEEIEEDDIKILPEVFINKEEKKIEGIKVNIETKFNTGN